MFLEKSTQPGRRTAAWKCPRGFLSSETTGLLGSLFQPLPRPGLALPTWTHSASLSSTTRTLSPAAHRPLPPPPCPLGLCSCHSPHTHHPPSCPRATVPVPPAFWEGLESGDVQRLPLWAVWARTERGQGSLRICTCSIKDFEWVRTRGPWLQRRCSWPRGRCYARWLPPGGRRVALLAGDWAWRSSQRGQDSPCDGHPERARLPDVFLIRITRVYIT